MGKTDFIFEFNVFLPIEWYIKHCIYISENVLTKKIDSNFIFFEKLNFLINPAINPVLRV